MKLNKARHERMASEWTYGNGLFQKKFKQGGLGIYFLKKNLELIHLLPYPRKFQTKQIFNPGNSSSPLIKSSNFYMLFIQ